MFKTTWRSLIARKARLLMSAFAIVLGVAFVVGSLTFTDTLNRAFTGIMNGTVGDVMVRPAGVTGSGEGAQGRTLPASLVTVVGKVPGVARAEGEVVTFAAYVLDKHGKPLGAQGSPGLGSNFHTANAGHGLPGLKIISGHAPRGRDELTLDPRSAAAAGYHLGDTVPIVTAGNAVRISGRLVGLAQFGTGGLAGATLVTFDTATAQQYFNAGRDVFQDIWVTAQPGVSQADLRSRIAAVLPKSAEAVTGDKAAKDAGSNIREALGFINTFLLVFAGIALVVGAFLIVNTFSMLAAQRTRELALLRALGASRRQVSRSVLIEALIVGLVGSALGIALGYAIAIGIKALFARLGLDISSTALVFRSRTWLAGLLIGVLVTAVAAYLPARRASRVPPVAALRDDTALPERALRIRFAAGLATLAVAASALAGVLKHAVPQEDWVLAAGMLLTILGVIMIAPIVARPIIKAIGLLYRRPFRMIGVLAEQNALRSPRRTAATASALMIGLALVSMMTVFGESAKASVDRVIKDNFTGDYVVSSQYGAPFSPAITKRLAHVPGVADAVPLRFARATVNGERQRLSSIDPAGFAQIVRVQLTAGALDRLVGDTVVVQDDVAAAHHVTVGDRVSVRAGGSAVPMTVVGIYRKSPAILSTYVTSPAGMAALGTPDQDNFVYIVRKPGADAAQVHRALNAVVAQVPTVTVKDQAEFAAVQREPIDQLLRIIYALLGLAIVIAVLGIVNTLALSVVERVREIGLLRAVALTRGQVRRMIRLEAVSMSVLGAILGVLVGVVLGWVLQRTQSGQGVVALVVPWRQLIGYVVLAAVVGVLAAWWPARRAAKLDILQAIATE